MRIRQRKKGFARYRNSIFSLIIVGGIVAILWFIINQGEKLTSHTVAASAPINGVAKTAIGSFHALAENLTHPLSLLLLQIIVIIGMARVLGMLMVRIGQPTVMGEIIAGIILGPSLLGLALPEVNAFLFPINSLGNLQLISQIGLILFMFIIGMELDLRVIRRNAQTAMIISHVSIALPFLLGVILAYMLYPNFGPKQMGFTSFALFIGIAVSITAFPVLARIVQERGWTKSEVGITAITCAAANDITAWFLLAAVIALVKAGNINSALVSLGLSAVYITFMLLVVKPLFHRIAEQNFTKETINKPIVAIFLLSLIISAYLTEVIGIHALFGAFLAGVIMPTNIHFRHVFQEKVEDLSQVLLLPLFFVYTGLRTQIGLLNEPHLWMVFAAIVLVATLGKFAGSALAARWVGQPWKNSLILGALMNTRGLMELIVLNIGYDLGVLTPQVFAMMVLMALVTTFMTGPAIDTIEYFYREKGVAPSALKGAFNVLISFGAPQAGSRLLMLAEKFTPAKHKHKNIMAAHFTPSADISIQNATLFEKEGFEPILATAKEGGYKINTFYKATNEVRKKITEMANSGNYDFMLVGSSKQILSSDETGGKVGHFFDDVECSVGVLIDRGFTKLDRIAVILDDPSDNFLLKLGERINEHGNTIVNALASFELAVPSKEKFHLQVLDGDKHTDKLIEAAAEYDLAIVSKNFWKKTKDYSIGALLESQSLLIVNK